MSFIYCIHYINLFKLQCQVDNSKIRSSFIGNTINLGGLMNDTKRELWECVEDSNGPEGYQCAVKSGDRIIVWVGNIEDAEFISRSHDIVPRLVKEIMILMSGLDNVRDFMRSLDDDLKNLDVEMKRGITDA